MTDNPLTVQQWCDSIRGARVFHAPLTDEDGRDPGNNGDHLMTLGAVNMFREQGIELTDDAAKADVIAIRGNGAMIDRYRIGPDAVHRYSQQYADKPLCILPATYRFIDRSLTSVIGPRTGPVTLFCREAISHRHLTQDMDLPAHWQIGLDHDMAFRLEGSDLAQRLRELTPRHLLLVERTDAEHAKHNWSTTPNPVANPSRPLRARLPRWIKRPLYPLVDRLRAAQKTPWQVHARDLIQRDYPQLAGAPRINADVSATRVCDFDQFCQQIAQAHVVLTTRLHVGIFSVILGRPTVIYSGAYHKIRGIYEQSLASRPDVQLIEPEAWLPGYASPESGTKTL